MLAIESDVKLLVISDLTTCGPDLQFLCCNKNDAHFDCVATAYSRTVELRHLPANFPCPTLDLQLTGNHLWTE